jgi:hypothetical protein
VAISPHNAQDGLMATVALAYFSVKEYLISDRIQESSAQHFAVSSPAAHCFIAEYRLLYILHYVSEVTKTRSRQDLSDFPLLSYTSEQWYVHIN